MQKTGEDSNPAATARKLSQAQLIATILRSLYVTPLELIASITSHPRLVPLPWGKPRQTINWPGAETGSVNALPQRYSQVLDEWFDKHAGGIDGQNDNFLPPLRQPIPFQPRLAEDAILFHGTEVCDLAGIVSGDIVPTGAVIRLPDPPQYQRL